MNELYHWGIKGQRWGIRRYQNEDGSLTEEGRIRYARAEAREARIAARFDVANQRMRNATGVRRAVGGAGMAAVGAYLMLKKYPDKIVEGGKKEATGGLARVGGALLSAIGVARFASGVSNLAYNPADQNLAYLAEQKTRKLDVSGMTDDELRAATTRNRLENDYYTSLGATAQRGEQKTNQLMSSVGDAAKVAGDTAKILGLAATVKKTYDLFKGKPSKGGNNKDDDKEDD